MPAAAAAAALNATGTPAPSPSDSVRRGCAPPPRRPGAPSRRRPRSAKLVPCPDSPGRSRARGPVLSSDRPRRHKRRVLPSATASRRRRRAPPSVDFSPLRAASSEWNVRVSGPRSGSGPRAAPGAGRVSVAYCATAAAAPGMSVLFSVVVPSWTSLSFLLCKVSVAGPISFGFRPHGQPSLSLILCVPGGVTAGTRTRRGHFCPPKSDSCGPSLSPLARI